MVTFFFEPAKMMGREVLLRRSADHLTASSTLSCSFTTSSEARLRFFMFCNKKFLNINKQN